MYENFIKQVHQADTVSLFMHINPDADCIGSALALQAFLINMGKTAHVFLEPNNIIKDNLKFLPYIEKINAAELPHYDLAVALDCGDAGRLGKACLSRFMKADYGFSVDHHQEPVSFFADDCILETKAASTAQILFKILMKLDKKHIDDKVAALLFAGLIADSGGLSYPATSRESYEVAAELSSYNIDTGEIYKKLLKEVNLNTFMLTNRVLSGAEFLYGNKIAVITFRLSDFSATGTGKEDTEGIINKLIDINCVVLAVSIAELSETSYQISFRSKGAVSALSAAKYFGGGGHFHAGGCRINTSYGEVRRLLSEMVEATGCLTVS